MNKRLGILISGRGSNMVALAEACAQDAFPAEVAVVISNRPNAAGLERAQGLGLNTLCIDHKGFDNREAFDSGIDAALRDAGVDLVCLAGFMRIQSDEFVERWRDRQVNIHPSLLPSFPGLHPHRQALDAGVRYSGCTVHIVRPDVDSGPILGQAVVPVETEDDEEALSARILAAEHQLYPRCVEMLSTGDVTIENDRAVFHTTARPDFVMN